MVQPKKQNKRLKSSKKNKLIKKYKDQNKRYNERASDAGIPNSTKQLKDDLLKEIKENKAKEAEDKANYNKEATQLKTNVKKPMAKPTNNNRKRTIDDVMKSAEKRTQEFIIKHAADTQLHQTLDTGPLELSRKSYYKEFKKVVDAADVVIQVLDARDPLGCRCQQIEELVMSSGVNKKMVFLLNKIDLIPKKVAESWLKYLREEFPTLAFKSSTQNQKNKLQQMKVKVESASQDLLQTSACIGAGTLLKLLGNYTRAQDTKQMITVGVVGFPNVGKSSVINSLKRSRACNVGNTPGVTKNMQVVQLDKYVKLLDSPGIVMAMGNSDTQIILRNAVKVEQLSDPIEPVEAILGRCNKHDIMEKYQVADYRNTQEFLTHLATRLGKLKKGGIPDAVSAAKFILQEWNNGKISFYTHPPKRQVDHEHTSAKVVQYFGAGFDLKEIEKEEESDFSDLMAAMDSGLVIDPSKPSTMDLEPGEDDDLDDELDDDESSVPVINMDSDDDDLLPNNVVVVKKRKTDSKTTSQTKEEAEWGTGVVVTDANNMQMNRQNRKKFKQRQKKQWKQEQKMLAEDKLKMRTDEDGDLKMGMDEQSSELKTDGDALKSSELKIRTDEDGDVKM